MKTTHFILLSTILLQTAFSEPLKAVENPDLPTTLIIELEGLGSKGNYHWNRFTEGMTQAFEETDLYSDYIFHNFPAKDKKGNPAIQVRLHYWDEISPLGEMKLWVRYITPNGEKMEWETILCPYEGWGYSEGQIEKANIEHAYLASKLLIEEIFGEQFGEE